MIFQLGSALLDACILAILSRKDEYGYALTQDVKEILDVSESTLYPVLRRLQKEGCLTTYDMPFGGRNRRYYQITDRGRDMLGEYSRECEEYREKIGRILSGNGGAQNEQE